MRKCVVLAVVLLAVLLEATRPMVATASPHVNHVASIPLRQSLVARALQAVNDQDEDALRPVLQASALATFQWIHAEATTHWQAGILTLPAHRLTAGPSQFVVFHAWHGCESDGDHIHPIVREGPDYLLGPEIPEFDPMGYAVRSHVLRVSLDIDHQVAMISDTISVDALDPKPPANILLRISQDFHVQSVAWAGKPLRFTQVGGVLAVAAPTKSEFHLVLNYAGVLNHQGSDYILRDEAVLNSYWYPHTARLPATSTVTVTAPAGWTAVGQGDLTSKIAAPDGTTTFVFKNQVPVCYQSLDLGEYTVTSRTMSGITLAVCLLKPDPDLATTCLDRLQSALHFFSTTFSKYPYKSYTIVETDGPFETPLEGYSMATFRRKDLPSVIAHEVAHTWWGGLVPCTYLHSMWDEAFADYSDMLFQESLQPQVPPGTELKPVDWGSAFNRVPLSMCHDTLDENQAETGYRKGSLVLKVLSAVMGHRMMLSCMREFLRTHEEGSSADWPDFEKAVALTTGRKYAQFFREWLDRTGLPSLAITSIKTTPTSNGGTDLTFAIVQQGAIYNLQVPVYIQLKDGNRVIAITDIDRAKNVYTITCPSQPVRIRLNPENTIPLSNVAGLTADIGNNN